MLPRGLSPRRHGLLAVLFALAVVAGAVPARPAGVTLVTHGFNADVGPWVIPMLEAIPRRFGRLGASNAACLQVTMIHTGGGNHAITVTNLNGVSPTAADTGEILIKLDWSDFAGSLFSVNFSTTYVAERLVPALLSSNLIPGLGRPLVELPLHLAGHSRGASLMCEVSRLLGAQGVWVDHLTLMDPYPLNNDGNNDPYSVVDGSCQVYANVLFADNYWQNIGGFLVPVGQPRPGAYNRRLTNLSGGYSSAHSDVHLWYHGTMDLRTPITVDGATIGAAERTNWWTAFEARGTNAGFLYSRIAGGDRLSDAEPAGAGLGRPRDGFNQRWDLGAGVSANRTILPTNAGAWPNPVRFDVTGTNHFAAGAGTGLRLYHQSAAGTNATITFRVLLDPDLNPFNGNETLTQELAAPGTGTNAVVRLEFDLMTDPVLVVPGHYAVGVVAVEGARRRHLYAPQTLVIGPSLLTPAIPQVTRAGDAIEVTVQGTAGQRLVLEAATDLADWLPLATNVVGAAPWLHLDTQALLWDRRFYRAVLVP